MSEYDNTNDLQCCNFSTNLPLLMVFLPKRGSKTGSTFSGRFSIRMVSPEARAFSMTPRYLWNKKGKANGIVLADTVSLSHSQVFVFSIGNQPLLTPSAPVAPPSAGMLTGSVST